MNAEPSIKVKAMCLFVHHGKILASPGYDKSANKHFYRLPGGKMELGETAHQTIQREISEELDSHIENLRFLEVVENIFIFEKRQYHEIVFIFSGDLSKTELYETPIINFKDGENNYEAHWVSIKAILTREILLYPEFDYKKYLAL
jgi:8-oxo-dGTP pyrophosphatase MutT (NUDIX family)